METRAIKTRIFKENEDIIKFLLQHIVAKENSIVVLTSKIVSLAEGRVVALKNKKQKVSLIKKESDLSIETGLTWFTIKNNMVMAQSGIDESNGNGKLILLPKDSYKSAEKIRRALRKKFKIKNLGVLITDSGFTPMRSGAVGMALGYAGFEGVKNYIGRKDIFGRVLKLTRTNVADALSAAAVLCMGEGMEQQPIAMIAGAPVKFKDKINKKELVIPPKKDIYAPLFNKIN